MNDDVLIEIARDYIGIDYNTFTKVQDAIVAELVAELVTDGYLKKHNNRPIYIAGATFLKGV